MPGEEFHPDNKSDDQGAQQQHGTDGPDLNALREAASNAGFSPEGSGHENEPVAEVGGEVLEHAGIDEPENTEHGEESEGGNVEQLEKDLETARDKWSEAVATMEKLSETSKNIFWVEKAYANAFPDRTNEVKEIRNMAFDFTGAHFARLINKTSDNISNAVAEVQRLEAELEKAR